MIKILRKKLKPESGKQNSPDEIMNDKEEKKPKEKKRKRST